MIFKNDLFYKWFSHVTLAAALIIGGLALFRTWQLFSSLPPGVCPMVHYRSWIYVALALSLVSFGASFLETRFRSAKNIFEEERVEDARGEKRSAKEEKDRSDQHE